MNIQGMNIKISQEAVCSLCLNYFRNKKEIANVFSMYEVWEVVPE